MTLEEVKQELRVFDKFKFFEEDHHYECNGKRVGISVTKLIEEYSNPFDQQAIAEKVAMRDNKGVSDVIGDSHYVIDTKSWTALYKEITEEYDNEK